MFYFNSLCPKRYYVSTESLQKFLLRYFTRIFFFISNLQNSVYFIIKASLNLDKPHLKYSIITWSLVAPLWDSTDLILSRRKNSLRYLWPSPRNPLCFWRALGQKALLCVALISSAHFQFLPWSLFSLLDHIFNTTEISRWLSVVAIYHDVTLLIFKFSPLRPHFSIFFKKKNFEIRFIWNQLLNFLFRVITFHLAGWPIAPDGQNLFWSRILSTKESGIPPSSTPSVCAASVPSASSPTRWQVR